MLVEGVRVHTGLEEEPQALGMAVCLVHAVKGGWLAFTVEYCKLKVDRTYEVLIDKVLLHPLLIMLHPPTNYQEQ